MRAATVDIALPDGTLGGLDIRGNLIGARGANAAAARVAAEASTLLAADPRLTTAELKARLLAKAKPIPGEHGARTRHGFLDLAGLGWLPSPK